MSTISLLELQQDTAGLLARVAAGEHLVVLLSGRPVAELRPITRPPCGQRPVGLAEGEFVVPDDFDTPLPEEVLREFEGR